MRKTCSLFSALALWIIASAASADGIAKGLFQRIEPMVYQIRVIDIASGDKYTIGSGFSIGTDGQIATNFHVVSSYVHEPEKYRLEYVAHDGSTGDLSLSVIDVIHDLAIVHGPQSDSSFLQLASTDIQQGSRVYSMGNPLDLGMTIIEGTYNGLVEHSRYRKILFSGSLNPGMSGGPALNQQGEVIGINVSKGGEQISFLVPVAHLVTLQEQDTTVADSIDYKQVITASLLADQKAFYSTVLESEKSYKTLGNLRIPDELSDSLKCWGHTVDKEEHKYVGVHQHCRSEDEIYISQELYVGNFAYDFEHISTAELNRFQFYSLLQQRFTQRTFGNTYSDDEVSDYQCHSAVVGLESGAWKTASCFRAYKKYPGLYDASMSMTSIDRPLEAGILKVGAAGVSKDNAMAMFRYLMGAVQWKD